MSNYEFNPFTGELDKVGSGGGGGGDVTSVFGRTGAVSALEADYAGFYLKLDQTTPQTISNGAPDFAAGLSVGGVYSLPTVDGGNGQFIKTNGAGVLSWNSLAASDIASGTFADARISESSVTQHQAALSITESQISDFGSYLPLSGGTLTGQLDITPSGTDLPLVMTKLAQASTREQIAKFSVSDAGNSQLFIGNGTSVNGSFAPIFGGINDNVGTIWSQAFNGYVTSTYDASDSSNYGIISFSAMRTTNAADPANGTLSNIQNRKLFGFYNYNQSTPVLVIDADSQVNMYGTLNLDDNTELAFNGTTILSDASGVATLSNIDALDATTEATIEAAIDTLSNLTSAPSLSITESQISDLDHTDPDAIHDNVAGEINAITEKGTPVNGDWILIEDSADSNNKKKIQVGNLPSGGGGEANTASNAGTGTSLYYQKSGVDLEFNGIKSENNRLTVSLDGVTHDIELTVNEGNIDHDALANYVANEHIDWTVNSGSTIDNNNLDADLQTLASPTNWRLFYSNGSGTITELALGTSGQVLQSNGASSAPSFEDASGGSSDNIFFAYDNTGAAAITGTAATLNIDTTVRSDSAYTLSADEVTINEAGDYEIFVEIQLEQTDTAGAARTSVTIRLQEDPLGVGSWANISGASGKIYGRETEESSGTLMWVQTFSATDKLRVQLQRQGAAMNIQTSDNHPCKLRIRKIL